MHRLSVLIAEDHPIVRKGLEMMLNSLEIISHTHEVGDGEAALAFILENTPELLLLDIHMPKLDGIQVIQKLNEHYVNRIKVILISQHLSKELAKELKQHSIVKGALPKDVALEELTTCIQEVSKGNIYFSKEMKHEKEKLYSFFF